LKIQKRKKKSESRRSRKCNNFGSHFKCGGAAIGNPAEGKHPKLLGKVHESDQATP